jgi:hypothetical protein
MLSRRILSYQEFVRALVSLCRDKSSGTLFYNLKNELCARIVLIEGEIKWVAFNGFTGEKAIAAIRNIDSGRLNFNPKLQLMIGNQHLPSTLTILREIKKKSNREHIQGLLLNDEKVSSIIGSNDSYKMQSNNNACKIIEEGGLDNFCPIVKFLSTNHKKLISPQLSQTQICQVIDSIVKSINDK